MMKKLFLMLIFMNFSIVSAYDFTIGGITYRTIDESPGDVEVIQTGFPGYYNSIVIPETVNHGRGGIYNIKGIGDYAFANSNITDITIPSSIDFIGEFAFANCSKLTEITCNIATPLAININVFNGIDFNNSRLIVPVDNITDYKSANVWNNFNSITEIITVVTFIENGIKYEVTSVNTVKLIPLENGAYSTDVIIPATVSYNNINYNVTAIGASTFANSYRLEKVTIPSSITSIEEKAFSTNNSLVQVVCNIERPLVMVQNVFENISPSCTLKVPENAIQAYSNNTVWMSSFSSITSIVAEQPIEIIPATHLNFDGVNDYITLPSTLDFKNDFDTFGNPIRYYFYTNSLFHFTKNMTIEFWMNSSVAPMQWDALVTQGDDSWRLSLNANGTVNFAGDDGFGDVSSSISVIDGNWHHVAATYNGVNAIIYIDGIQSGSVIGGGSIRSSNFPVAIGENKQATGRFYSGKIDEVRIWNVARTATEINEHKNCELLGVETGLMAYYKFNQGDSAKTNKGVIFLEDATGGISNNGILNNFELTGTMSNWDSGSPIVTDVVCNEGTLNTGKVQISSKVKVYLNTTNDLATIDITDLKNVELQVLDITGKILMIASVDKNKSNINISQLAPGLYLFRFFSNQGGVTHKIIKN